MGEIKYENKGEFGPVFNRGYRVQVADEKEEFNLLTDRKVRISF